MYVLIFVIIALETASFGWFGVEALHTLFNMTAKRQQRQAMHDYDRIGQALRYLDSHREHPVRLAELARNLELSEFHFQRLFTRWAGISPKRFGRYLQIADARALLRDARSILDTSLEIGLSSPSRLHDLFVSVDAVSPGEFKSGGEGLDITYGEHSSPFGACLVALTPRGICWLSFADDERDGLKELMGTWPAATFRHCPRETRTTVEAIFSGATTSRRRQFRLVVSGTNFQVKVWEALIAIPPGTLVTYSQLSHLLGSPKAARAVGNAVAANPISYLIPCHRVIRSMGIAGNYRWGPERKRLMIAWEDVRCDTPAKLR